MHQDRPVFSSFFQGNCVFQISFSESVLSCCEMAEWESVPPTLATANQITWVAEPYWPINFSSLGFKNSGMFLICELDIENWRVTCSWGRWCDAHPGSRMTQVGGPRMETMVVGLLEAFAFQLHFLPLGAGRGTETCQIFPANAPLLTLTW